MPEEIKEHSHCVVCGKITPAGEFFCSDECKNKVQDQQENIKKKRTILIILIIVLAASIMVLSVL